MKTKFILIGACAAVAGVLTLAGCGSSTTTPKSAPTPASVGPPQVAPTPSSAPVPAIPSGVETDFLSRFVNTHDGIVVVNCVTTLGGSLVKCPAIRMGFAVGTNGQISVVTFQRLSQCVYEGTPSVFSATTEEWNLCTDPNALPLGG